VLRIYGIPVPIADVLSLIDMLEASAHPDASEAAAVITSGVERGMDVGLTREARAAILSVLDNAPQGLAELRARLLRDDDAAR
jgi:hypothetical protein